MEGRRDLRDKRGESSVTAEEIGEGGDAGNRAETEEARIAFSSGKVCL